MVVNLIYFYQGQDELFDSTKAIHAAARNITDWLIARNHRNVVIDVANEYDLGDRWDFNDYIPQNIIPAHRRGAGALPARALQRAGDGIERRPHALSAGAHGAVRYRAAARQQPQPADEGAPRRGN